MYELLSSYNKFLFCRVIREGLLYFISFVLTQQTYAKVIFRIIIRTVLTLSNSFLIFYKIWRILYNFHIKLIFDSIIEHYVNLSKAYKEKILNGVLSNATDDLLKCNCKLPPYNESYVYHISYYSDDYNFNSHEGEYVYNFALLLIICIEGFVEQPIDKTYDDVVVCENGTWSHEIKCLSKFGLINI